MSLHAPPAATVRTVGDALRAARALGLDRLDAQWLLAHRLGRPRTWVMAHDTDPLHADAEAEYLCLARRRAAGEPLAYLIGEKEFFGLTLGVTPAVLVPRPETEHLVDWALACLDGLRAPRVLDLGTGSGAIALAIASARPDATVTATDASPAALAVARANAARLGLAVDWRAGDWWEALVAGEHFDLIASNPPYVAGNDPHLDALRHEPRAALTPEGDGLAALRTLCADAPAHLRAGGWLLLEHGHDQGAAVRALLADAGFEAVATRRDLAGHERCTGGRRPQGHGADPARALPYKESHGGLDGTPLHPPRSKTTP